MGSIHASRFNVKCIAVIGAGPAGLAAAKYLRAQGTYDRITIFEQQAEVGGVWNLDAVVPAPNPIPQTSPFYPPDEPVRVPQEKFPIFPSPMYNKLHANIPKSIMMFSDLEFPRKSWIFPSRHDVQDYLVKYSLDVRHLVKFCSQVKRVLLQPENGQDRWRVMAQSTLDGRVSEEVFDAVVVANGHYSTPFVPDIKNIMDFHRTHPSVITHSKSYHSADIFRGKKTLIVGNGPSGLDIAHQINHVSKGQTILSVRHETPPKRLQHTGCREIAEIDEFLVDRRGVRLKDGLVEADIDAVVFCTGFRYSFPFLDKLEKELITNGSCVHGLYKHLIYIQHPTLVFPALNTRVVPFPVSEAQAAVFSAVWSNHLHLPSKPEMLRWNKAAEEAGDELHIMADGQDGVYLNELHDYAMTASKLGKEPPRWGDEQFWIRRIILDAKMAFEDQGCEATTLEELGSEFLQEEDG
ncbi:Flavin monooxygenase-like protein [Metarhizium album ARSEF 1941]|uniref:Flavin monooxygenase-like protein n=1 Tax=Metarhizium album (strain ARSEF 1941) TaxID=1081103 RepID=A0A0B2WP30_METAS|nr:Flavin monooxygenase-like protein [Metarhizium album ARSEF 1941]KHN95753.1 Flavin monooxygenase-like protein [Metarhizium album ARSEF 1941]